MTPTTKINGHRADRLGADARWPSWLDACGDLRDRHTPGEHALDGFMVDCLRFSACCVAHCAVCDAIDIAKRSGCVLVHQCHGVGCEDALLIK
jgi:hypothetical protein